MKELMLKLPNSENFIKVVERPDYLALTDLVMLGPAFSQLTGEPNEPVVIRVNGNEFCFINRESDPDVVDLYFLVKRLEVPKSIKSISMMVLGGIDRTVMTDFCINGMDSFLMKTIFNFITNNKSKIAGDSLEFVDREVILELNDGSKLAVFSSEFGGISFTK